MESKIFGNTNKNPVIKELIKIFNTIFASKDIENSLKTIYLEYYPEDSDSPVILRKNQGFNSIEDFINFLNINGRAKVAWENSVSDVISYDWDIQQITFYYQGNIITKGISIEE